MNILEKYHIYKICQQGKHLNDIYYDRNKPDYHGINLPNNNPIYTYYHYLLPENIAISYTAAIP
jgi:hypothetical protein